MVCRRALAVVLLRTSSRRDRRQMARREADRCGSSDPPAKGASSTLDTGAAGALWLRDAASAAHTSSPSLSETARCAGLFSEPGSAHGALDLLCGLSTVLGHEIRASWALGEDGLGETLEHLLVAVLDTAEVITEEYAS